MFSEATLYLDVTTPLSQHFTLVSLEGEEGLSVPFAYDLVLQSPDGEVDPAQIVGQAVTVSISLETGGFRYLHGVVRRWVREEQGLRSVVYHAHVVPWLWQLTLAEDHRIFQNQTVPDIVTAVFDDLGFADYTLSLQGQYEAREYCVQYGETAFAFVSRLMEEEGIFYFFAHEDGKHTLVLADDNAAFAALANLPTAEVLPSPDDDPDDAAVRSVRFEASMASGEVALCDYNFETPETSLFVTAEGDQEGLRVYAYPGGYGATAAGETQAGLRMDAREAARTLMVGEGYCRDFTAGYTFTLQNHPLDAANVDYVLRAVRITATQDQYLNTFTAAPATLAYRPPRKTPKPRIAGVQTALVVGKAGEEIWTDKYGRVKVQFHWDQEGRQDENSSCWIRVQQQWAGKGWGRLFLPRVGMEALVSFLDGDPDRPLITGAVYNATQTVPYALPDEQTKSTVKTHSSKGGDGFNELRFEDKKGDEEVYLHAQKDFNTVVEHDAVTHVMNHRQVFVQPGDPAPEDDQVDLLQVEGNRKINIVGSDTLELHLNEGAFEQLVTKNFTLKVDGDTLLIEATNDLILKGKTVSIESTGGDVTITSAQNVALDAGGSYAASAATSCTTEAGTSLTNKAGTELTNQAGTNLNNKAGVNLTNEGGVTVENKGTLVKDTGSALVQVKGALVQIN